MTARDQAATLRDRSAPNVIPLRSRRRRFVAVSGGKGGVGKSTVSVNLAAAYALRGSKTLAIDGDLGMADLNLLLGLAPTMSILDVLLGTPVSEALVEVHGMHLLAGLNGSHQLANLGPDARRLLLDAIRGLERDYESIVIDTAAGIDDVTMDLAAVAADVVVVATGEPLSLADAYSCLKVLVKQHGIERAFLVPNSIRAPGEAEQIGHQLSVLVDRFLGIELIQLPPIPFDPAVPHAGAAGIPLVAFRPDAPASRAIVKIASAIDALGSSESGPRQEAAAETGEGKGEVR